MDETTPTFTFDTWRCLRKGVFVCTAQPESVTIGCVLGDDHALLVDTGSCPAQGTALAASVTAAFGRCVDRVVITHAHFDHWFGLSGIRDAESYGHAGLVREARDCVDASIAYAFGFSPELIVSPRVLVRDSLVLDLGGRTCELHACGPAHSTTDLVVRVPDADLLFMGDIIEQANDPEFGPDCTPSQWADTIETAIAGTGPDSCLVPGHGDPVDPAFALNQAARIRTLQRRITALWTSGVRLSDALNSLTVPAEVPWPFGPAAVRKALIVTYAELGGEADRGVRLRA
ncbi:MAG: MBL fold metallo-hydrolase [Actinomycetia bacterium]|nr:MBL fold metallo-hydrolase [Actinomycetes bacterium]